MKDPRGKLPGMLFIGAVSMLAWSIVARLSDGLGACSIAAAALLLAYLVWLALEAHITFGEAGKGPTPADRGSVEVYGIGRFAIVVAATLAPTPASMMGARMAAAFSLYFLGVGLRLIAIRTLGRFYSHRVRTVSEHRIITTGPYRWIRHPAYTGMLVAHVGLVLFFSTAWTVGLFLLLFLPAIIYRIYVEELALSRLDEYVEYSKSRWRLLPYIW